jgi:2-hydroxy-3-keto-5-methylthiopentenyl-1-phosphate phosphatase
MPDAILVSDFDGTMTTHDFFRLAAERLMGPGALVPWDEYKAGRRTHFAALHTIFDNIRAPEEAVVAVVRAMELDPGLAASLARLGQAGWEVVVASAGCGWYIDRLLAEAGAALTVHANPGEYRPGGPLVMKPPVDSPFYCEDTGVDKAAVVRDALSRAGVVAFAGDGGADLPASLLVPAELRFARHELAEALAARGEGFRPYSVWSDVAEALLAAGGKP